MKKIIFFLILLFFLYSAEKSRAESTDYAVNLKSKYVFAENGSANVAYNFELLNLTTNYYPASFVINVPQDAKNIISFDNIGKIEPQISRSADFNQLTLTFNKASAGISRSITLAVSYTTESYFRTESRTRKIAIPIDKSELNYLLYNVELLFPASWGEPQIVKPYPEKKYFWDRDDLTENQITLDFLPLKETLSLAPNTIKEEKANYLALALGIVLGLVMVFAVYLIAVNFNRRK